MTEWMERCLNKRMNEWINEWMNALFLLTPTSKTVFWSVSLMCPASASRSYSGLSSGTSLSSVCRIVSHSWTSDFTFLYTCRFCLECQIHTRRVRFSGKQVHHIQYTRMGRFRYSSLTSICHHNDFMEIHLHFGIYFDIYCLAFFIDAQFYKPAL